MSEESRAAAEMDSRQFDTLPKDGVLHASEAVIHATAVPQANEVENRADDKLATSINHFRELLPSAKDTLKRILLMSDNEKLSAQVALDIVELAGEGKGIRGASQQTVIINDSDVQLLLQVTREVAGYKGEG